MSRAPGVFTISLDTELAWGSFDRNGVERYGDQYRTTPTVVERLCALFDGYDVTATWAFVAHLFDECSRHASADPGRERWLDAAPCQTGVDRSLWYAPDLLETVRSCPTPQEIGLHGYSHAVFDEHSRAAAREELRDARAAARDRGLDPSSLVYPRNGLAHVDLLPEFGIDASRSRDARWYERRAPASSRGPLRFLDELAGATPPTVVPSERAGVVHVPGSQVFRPDRGAWGWTPDGTQASRARKGLGRAARTGEIFHLWFHPFNIAADIDHHLSILEEILMYVTRLRDDNELEVLSLSEVATAHRDGRWTGTPRQVSPS